MNLGIRGGAYLFVLRDLDAAIDCFSKDLELVQMHGLDTDVSGTANKLSTAYWWKSAGEKDPVKIRELKQQAEENAAVAWESALRLERKNDMAFAGNQYIDILCTLIQERTQNNTSVEDLVAQVNVVGNRLANQDLWKEVTNPFAQKGFQSVIKKFSKQSYEWMEHAKTWLPE